MDVEHSKHHDHPAGHPVVDAGSTEKDPVCGTTVVPGVAKGGRASYGGHEYWFCSARCHDRFVAEPEKYVAPAPPALPPKRHPSGVAYTCPMHPQIIRDAPGSCPICGMALEPRTPTAEPEDNPELRDMTRRLIVAAVLSGPLLVLAMSEMVPAVAPWMSMRGRTWIELALATPVCVWAAWPFYMRAVQSVRNRSLNMFTLIGLGIAVAYVYSVVAAVAPGMFPPAFRENGGVAVYFEAAGMITTGPAAS